MWWQLTTPVGNQWSLFTANQSSSNSIVVTDKGLNIKIDELASLNPHTAGDDREPDIWRPAEHESCQRIMHGSASEFKRIEAEADEVSGHSGSKLADIVATEDGGPATGG